MTTLAERRAWMRAGCPVYEPSPPQPDEIPAAYRPCGTDGYMLQVWTEQRRMVAQCNACSWIAGVDFPGSIEHENDLIPMIRGLCRWMDEHAGADECTAAFGLIGNAAGNRGVTLEWAWEGTRDRSLGDHRHVYSEGAEYHYRLSNITTPSEVAGGIEMVWPE